jgi:hypothetical protein
MAAPGIYENANADPLRGPAAQAGHALDTAASVRMAVVSTPTKQLRSAVTWERFEGGWGKFQNGFASPSLAQLQQTVGWSSMDRDQKRAILCKLLSVARPAPARLPSRPQRSPQAAKSAVRRALIESARSGELAIALSQMPTARAGASVLQNDEGWQDSAIISVQIKGFQSRHDSRSLLGSDYLIYEVEAHLSIGVSVTVERRLAQNTPIKQNI